MNIFRFPLEYDRSFRRLKMSLKIVVIAFLYLTKVSISAPIDSEESSKENDENVENAQLLDYYQSRGEEAFEFK